MGKRRQSEPLEQAIASMQGLKAEHRELLDRIAADEGMSPETRRALVNHVLEEEDEKLATIAHLAQRSPDPDAPSRPGPSGLTVGSMRGDDGWSPPSRGTVGSLRGS